MIKKLTFILILLVFTTSTLAISLDFDELILGQERSLKGNILLPPDSYDKTSKIKLTIDGQSDEKSIGDLINCTTDCEKTSSSYYVSTGATAAEITSTNFLTGLKIRKGSQIDEAANFKITYASAGSYPALPTIDVGDDESLEWAYVGTALDTWNLNIFRGPDMIAEPEEINLDSTGTCQNVFLNKSDKFQIKANLKKTIPSPPSLGIYIFGYGDETTLISCDPLQDTFTETLCEISTDSVLDPGDYKICLTAPSSGIVLAVNSSALNPRGYRCLSSCSTTNEDYILKAKSADFDKFLKEAKTYLQSNIYSGEYFKDALGEYLQTCTYDDNYCIVPINISVENNANVKIYDLAYIETLDNGQSYNRNKFLLGVQQESAKTLYETTAQKYILLSDFDLKSPSELGNYDLNVEFGLDSLTVPLTVIPAPVAKANVSIKLASTTQFLTFDASNSESNSTLTYLWDFGDNSSSTSLVATHKYDLPGIYKVILTVTDEAGISDDSKLTVEIYSEAATQQLITNTLSRLEALRDKFLNSNADIKDVYIGLGFNKKIEENLATLSTTFTLSESEVNSLLNEIPTSINIRDTLTITPYLSSKEIDALYGFETESYKSTLQELNTKFQKSVLARLISLSYPTTQENFILIKKTITPPQPINDISIIETIPLALAPSPDSLDFLEELPELTRLQDHQSAKFTIPVLQDSFSFYYKLQGNNLDAVKNTILIVIPKDLSPSLIPFNCGDGICNPAEDSLSCPEDCHCGNKICDPGETKANCPEDCRKFPWLTTLILLILLGAGGFAVYKFELYKKLKLDDLIETLVSKFQKSPYKSGTELAKVRTYIKDALEKGYSQEKITESLQQSGWSQAQIKHAFKKLKKKK